MTALSSLWAGVDRHRYRPSQRFVHWAMAVVIIAALAIGFYCALQAPGTQPRRFLLEIHKSLGMTALVLIVLRLPLRWQFGEPDYRKPLGRLTRGAAHAAHLLLYGSMLYMPISGYVYSGAGGNSLPWFGLFQWPRLLPLDKVVAHTGYLLHHYGAYVFYAVLAAHIAAVVWHRFVKRDEVLSRMV